MAEFVVRWWCGLQWWFCGCCGVDGSFLFKGLMVIL